MGAPEREGDTPAPTVGPKGLTIKFSTFPQSETGGLHKAYWKEGAEGLEIHKELLLVVGC